MVKNKKLAVTISSFALIFLIITGYSIWSKNYKYYDTPEQAVYGYEQKIAGIEYLSVLEDNGLGVVFYRLDGELCAIKIQKDDNKWRIVTNESIKNLIPSIKTIKEYGMSWGKCEGKFYVWINSTVNLIDMIPPKDSLDSKFLCHETPFGDKVNYDWFLVLDEEPQNYYVIINGEKVQLTE